MKNDMSPIELRLLNDYQRDFPLTPAPFREIAAQLGIEESAVLAALEAWRAAGTVSRVGAVFAPRRMGASTLAALVAPPDQLSRIASIVSSHTGVNHNYEREHRLNLWFVATAADAHGLAGLLRSVERQTGCQVIALPLVEEFHIDLAFDLLHGCKGTVRPPARMPVEPYEPTSRERRLMAALQAGLDLVPRPFARLAMKSGMGEDEVLALITHWVHSGLIKRFGVVVRHRELGYRANAMAVWDVPDDEVRAYGKALAAEPLVTLCYRRARSQPAWPYNLFCMIHGRHRLAVEATLGGIRDRHGLHAYPSAVLFSRRCFKQQGAHYFSQPPHVVPA
jgi:DNA-binding Lrp family transcriptional regulator